MSERPPSPSFWPGDVPGGEPGYTDHEEVGPIGAGTPHARMEWFWDRMRPHAKLIEELTGWSPFSSKYRFEAAIADAFDKLAQDDLCMCRAIDPETGERGWRPCPPSLCERSHRCPSV